MDERMNYEQFERDWLRKHKGSIVRPPKISSLGLIFGILLWALIATGAALVSGAHSVPAILHTIPAVVPSPLRDLLSLFGFTIFELLIFAGSAYRRSSDYAKWGLWSAMIGALFANVGSSVKAVADNAGGPLELAVALILALIAPLAAFLAGEMVHRLVEQHNISIADLQANYTDKRKRLDKQILVDFTKYDAQFHEPVHENFVKSGEGETVHETSRKAPVKRVKIHEVAQEVLLNGDENLSTAEMSEKYNIAPGSTTKIRAIIATQKGFTNGRGATND